MRELALVLVLVVAICFGLAHMQRDQKSPPAQDTHTQILKDSVYDGPKRMADCDPSEMTVECNGSKPR
jgi:hypothetical protein